MAGYSQVYEIKNAIAHRKTKGRTFYQVRWRGYDAYEDSQLKEAYLANACEILRAYQFGIVFGLYGT